MVSSLHLMKPWLILFVFEIIAAINAGLAFRLWERSFAGLIAGTVFVLVGIAAFTIVFQKAKAYRRSGFAISGIYLLIAFLLWGSRILTPFDQSVTQILGIPMAAYHPMSTGLFFLLMGFTLVQIWKNRSLASGLN